MTNKTVYWIAYIIVYSGFLLCGFIDEQFISRLKKYTDASYADVIATVLLLNALALMLCKWGIDFVNWYHVQNQKFITDVASDLIREESNNPS